MVRHSSTYGLVLSLLVALGLSTVARGGGTDAPTKAQWSRVKEHMTRAEVEKLLGKRGKELSAEDLEKMDIGIKAEGKEVKILRWGDGNRFAIGVFLDDKLVSKTIKSPDRLAFLSGKPNGKVSWANFARIKDNGSQTLAEVEKILGGKGHPVSLQDARDGMNLDLTHIKGTTVEVLCWWNDYGYIVVCVVKGKVEGKVIKVKDKVEGKEIKKG